MNDKTLVLLIKGLLARSCLDRVLRTLTRQDTKLDESVRQAVTDLEHTIEKINSNNDAWILGE